MVYFMGNVKNECTKGDMRHMQELSNIKRKVFLSYAFKDSDKIDFDIVNIG